MTTAPSNSPEPTPPGDKSTCGCGPWWRLPLLLALVLGAILLLNGRGVREQASDSGNRAPVDSAGTSDSDRSAAPVSLTIVFGDGRKQILDDVDWHVGMTVRDLLQAAPRVSVTQQGSGASAFLTTIDDVANQGAGGRNWMYSVNGERGDRSFAAYELQPGDHVLWTFAPSQ